MNQQSPVYARAQQLRDLLTEVPAKAVKATLHGLTCHYAQMAAEGRPRRLKALLVRDLYKASVRYARACAAEHRPPSRKARRQARCKAQPLLKGQPEVMLQAAILVHEAIKGARPDIYSKAQCQFARAVRLAFSNHYHRQAIQQRSANPQCPQ